MSLMLIVEVLGELDVLMKLTVFCARKQRMVRASLAIYIPFSPSMLVLGAGAYDGS